MSDADSLDPRIAAALATGAIVLFDAECVLCSANARLILTHDRTGYFHLAAMQGAIGAALFKAHGLDPADPTSILIIERTCVRRDSDAVIAIYEQLGFPWRLARLFRIIPRVIRDPIYRLIARNRYRLFGKRETCWLPDQRYRARML
jgi:predicted DCC family thiol-disulfide oxidoreductase YuxK